MESDDERSAISQIQNKLADGVSILSKIWKDIGITGNIKTQRLNAVKNHIETIVSDMTKEESNLREKLLITVANLTEEIARISKELEIENFHLSPELTILQSEKELRRKRDELVDLKKRRLDEADNLKKTDQNLCNMLVTTPYYLPSNIIPNEIQLKELRDHITKLEEEYKKRFSKFSVQRENIKKLMEDLEETPDTSFHTEVIDEAINDFCLSNENLQRVDKLESQLEKRQQSNFKEAKELRDRLQSLWNRIQIDDEIRSEFNLNNCGFKPSTILALKDEISRCEILKKENVSKVIEATRQELEKWWEQCFYSQQQKSAFKHFFDDHFTEELLDKHEEELTRVKNYYNKNEIILEKIKNYRLLWLEYLEYEERAHDPNRFNNRGGKILKEEKHRKKLEKELPKLEKQLLSDVAEWELKTKENILVEGVRFIDFVHLQKQDYEIQKQREKELRKQNKEKEIEKEMRFGSKPNVTPGKRRFMGTTIVAKSPKVRKIDPFTGMGIIASSESEGSTITSLKIRNQENETLRTPGRTPARTKQLTTPQSSKKYTPKIGFGYCNSAINTPLRSNKKKPVKEVNKILTEKNVVQTNNAAVALQPNNNICDLTIASVAGYAEFSENLIDKPNTISTVLEEKKVAYI